VVPIGPVGIVIVRFGTLMVEWSRMGFLWNFSFKKLKLFSFFCKSKSNISLWFIEPFTSQVS
jgi:hypothetical protein